MNMLVNFFILYVGFFFIALTILRQREQLIPQVSTMPLSVNWVLKIIGWAVLAIGMIFCIQQDGVGVGMTFWFGLSTLAALILSMLILYAPKFAIFLLPLAIIIWIFA